MGSDLGTSYVVALGRKLPQTSGAALLWQLRNIYSSRVATRCPCQVFLSDKSRLLRTMRSLNITPMHKSNLGSKERSPPCVLAGSRTAIFTAVSFPNVFFLLNRMMHYNRHHQTVLTLPHNKLRTARHTRTFIHPDNKPPSTAQPTQGPTARRSGVRDHELLATSNMLAASEQTTPQRHH